MNSWLWDLHLAATAIMVGVIWVTQLIQYPELNRVPSADFPGYHQRYTARIGLIVGPAMAMELLSGITLIFILDEPARTRTLIGLALLAVIWISTAAVQVPCHRRLGRGYDEAIHRRLVATNWLRTAAWTARLILLLASPHV